jgi:hypothetical protein
MRKQSDGPPSLLWAHALIVATSVLMVFNLVMGAMTIDLAAFALAALNAYGLSLGLSLRRTGIERRQAWRKERMEAWLESKLISPGDPVDWFEIERAMGELLKNNVEPTYERAKDYLVRERRKAEYSDQLHQQASCAHEHTERFDLYGGQFKVICADCGGLLRDTRRPNLNKMPKVGRHVGHLGPYRGR